MAAEARAPAILLAAGASSRVGEPKGLVVVDGERWIERQIASLAAAPIERVVVVLGHACNAYRAALPWVDAALAGQVIVSSVAVSAVINPRPELGPFSSLQCALARTKRGAFVLPIDVPCAAASVFCVLAEAVGRGAPAAVPVYASRGGHPVLLSDAVAFDLAAVDAESPVARLDVQLRARGESVARVPVDDARVAMNLNTRDDFEELALSWTAERPPRSKCDRSG